MSSGILLLQLLKKVDAARLEVLLEPHVLLHVLEEAGWSPDEVKARLEAGVKPGTLLHELFEERDVETVWASIPDELRQHTEETIAVRAERSSKVDRLRSVPVILALFGAVAPTMWTLGAFPEWGSGLTLGLFVFALVVSGGCGAWAYAPDRLAGGAAAATGAMASALAGWLLQPWVGPWIRLGVIIALIPGALVGGLVFFALARLRAEREPAAF